eukprot:5805032-Prymnesium_polylepis.2
MVELHTDGVENKMVATPMNLHYSGREAYVKGLEDILSRPTLTIEQEFKRDKTWVDWKGARYSLRGEWDYVNGTATRELRTPGIRDNSNEGMRPIDFLQTANEYIQRRREELSRNEKTRMLLLPPGYDQLSMEEILAVRLYSGPAYQPINDFLRQIGKLTGEFRHHVAHDPSLTFSCTVGHVCSAIRKLAAVTSEEEAAQPLYRGVRGELPRSFWVADEQGMIVAVDMGFMSTSRTRETPIGYMGAGNNVLWELEPLLQSDVAFH